MDDLAVMRRRGLHCGASLLALAWAGGGLAPAYAQNTAETAPPEQSGNVGAPGSNPNNPSKVSNEKATIVVVGVRGALATAQSIKKNAPTVVDSVTATDIGAF